MGFLSFLDPVFNAMAWIIVQFHAFFSLMFSSGSGWAWGLSIVLLVVVIRICLIPLFVKQIKTMRNMQALQPELRKIQQKYKHDKQRQQQELMKLYKETGTNPFASCLPILIQSPFFLALFRVLEGLSGGTPYGPFRNNPALVNSAKHARIFGAPIATKFLDSAQTIANFGANESVVKAVAAAMIVLMSASQFITQRQLILKNQATDTAGTNTFARQQKLLMYVFPVMFAVFGINFPIGVLVYWLTTNVWTMGQQLVVIRRNPTPGSPAAKAREERLAAKRQKAGQAAGTPAADAASAEDAGQSRGAQRHQPVRTSRSKRSTASAQGQGQQRAADAVEEGPADEAVPSERERPAKTDAASSDGPKTAPSKPAARTGQARTGQARTGQTRSGQARTGQAKSGQGKQGAQRTANRPAGKASGSTNRGGEANGVNDAKPGESAKPAQRANQQKRSASQRAAQGDGGGAASGRDRRAKGGATRGGGTGQAEGIGGGSSQAGGTSNGAAPGRKTGEVAGSASKKGK